jgi:hypothetical protein
MPNQASITNRINLLRGKSIHNPVQHFFSQLDKSKNMIVGLHWREYTLSETIEILGKMGFQIKKAYYFNTVPLNNSWLKSILDFFVYIVPSFRHFQVVIGQKCNKMNYSFWLTDANS